nr:hypothetical protein B0A51_11084 [Rachicladosporium sp. CCFEE 5018]
MGDVKDPPLADPSFTAVTSTLRLVSSPMDVEFWMIEVAKLPQKVLDWIRSNPKTAGLITIGVILIVAPKLVAITALKALGFRRIGPAFASRAAKWQASLGAVPAGVTFATLQSTAMDGNGLLIVNGVLKQIGAAGLSAQLAMAARQIIDDRQNTKSVKSKLKQQLYPQQPKTNPRVPRDIMQILKLLLMFHVVTTAAFTIPSLHCPTPVPKSYPGKFINYIATTSSKVGVFVTSGNFHSKTTTTSELERLSE